ncbi:IS200/IS605 family transposase [Kitasatospora hibisci]|uniref:IS200/IS605 family transposase n=1 Tax=Kitasatospora hibisci TaxID=3369522 RepID=UPI00375428A5
MAEYQNIRTGRHCAFALHAHLVFVTKYRHKVFAERHLTRLEEIMRDVCADFEVELVEFNGENNHVHLLVNFPPKVALSKLVNSLKGVSSRRLRQEYPELVKHYWRAQRLWSGSYFAGSVGGAPLSIVRQYTTGLKPGALRLVQVAAVTTHAHRLVVNQLPRSRSAG